MTAPRVLRPGVDESSPQSSPPFRMPPLLEAMMAKRERFPGTPEGAADILETLSGLTPQWLFQSKSWLWFNRGPEAITTKKKRKGAGDSSR